MARLLSASRAASIVGVPRGIIQKHIQNGELTSFEGKVKLSQLVALYPNTQIDKHGIHEKIEEFVANALKRARYAKFQKLISPDTATLASRVAILSKELSDTKSALYHYEILLNTLHAYLQEKSKKDNQHADVYQSLEKWLNITEKNLTTISPQIDPMIQKDDFLRVMAAQVHIMPSGLEYFVEGKNSILDSGLTTGSALNYGCNNGNCGKCKAKLISGKIEKIKQHEYVFNQVEKSQNTFLMCANTAVTDIEIEAEIAGSEDDIPKQSLTTKVKKIESITKYVSVLTLKTQRTKRLRFLAGQGVKLTINNKLVETLSIASCPCDESFIQFHIENNHYPFNTYVIRSLKPNDTVNIKGPEGHFVLDKDSTRPIIFIAVNTGFAPVKSLIEHAVTLEAAEYIHLYWINTQAQDPYLHNHCRAWNDALDNFNYTALNVAHLCHKEILTQEIFSACLSHLIKDHADLANVDIYYSIPDPLIELANTFFLAQGLDAEQIHVNRI
ncbi:2Fe-2S iron-sulfur cluster binding domain-containing protein [Beggiatoa alba]|nr:2Fe-2S iron-sulfur cluster binding domain-containing protein [Beggiatoa alba]